MVNPVVNWYGGLSVLGFESGVVVVSGAGWPATADGWAVVGGQEQGGVKGWFRSMAIPRRWADKT